MPRFNGGAVNQGKPGDGLARCAAEDHRRTLQQRKQLRHIPVVYNGIQYLGWETMPWSTRQQFLAGKGAVQVIRVA